MRRMYIIIAIVAVLSALLTVAYAYTVPGTLVVNSPQATTTPVKVANTAATSTAQSSAMSSSTNTGFGTYAYLCDEHVSMTLTPSKDLKTMDIKPIGGSYPPATTLAYIPAKSGVRYEGGGIVLTAHGETVTLGEGDSAINCSPAELPDMAPYNFGD